jgi:dTDP-4-amino-4,6-dideoxygalactose transaminase
VAERKIRLAKPFLPEKVMTQLEIVLKSGYWTQGKRVKEFEKLLADYLQIEHVVAVSSGTAALHLALMALGIGENDEVIIPAFSFAATANVVRFCRAEPVFVDIRTDDFCINSRLIEEKINSKTKVIMPVHEFGNVAEMEEIRALAGKYNLNIIEDAACALGSGNDSQKAGTFGDMGCFSFHPRKIISTGEGGAIVTDNSVLAERLKSLRSHGKAKVTAKKVFLQNGLNFRMTDIQGVIGTEQLKLIEDLIIDRIRQAELYNRELKDLKGVIIPVTKSNTRHTYQSYHLLLKDGLKDGLIAYLKKKNIESNIGAHFLPGLEIEEPEETEIDQYTPSTLLSEKEKTLELKYPEAYSAYKNGIVLPIGTHLNDDDLYKIISVVKEFVNELS